MPKKSPEDPILAAIREATESEPAAYALLEAQRWGDEPACPYCGSLGVYAMKDRKTGGRHKHYRWRCRDCKRYFSVRTGTVLEESRLPLRHWVYAFHKACSSKKGISALQVSRERGITHKSALYLMHRVRLAMQDDDDSPLTGTIEADETFVGGKPRHKKTKQQAARERAGRKAIVFAMVERGGRVRARHIERIHGGNLKAELRRNVDRGARIMTDEAMHYRGLGSHFKAGHETVNHSAGEYARDDVTTNTIEGFFALLKRGVYGTFHSVSRHHLHRYVSEFQFRYNTRKMADSARFSAALSGAEGKRLLYKGDAAS